MAHTSIVSDRLRALIVDLEAPATNEGPLEVKKVCVCVCV